jgi:hypothetical protein
VSGRRTDQGYRVEVADRGDGIGAAELAALNARLEAPAPGGDGLGLYVAGRLAGRHGVGVTLTAEPDGGTTAVVTVPAMLVAADQGAPPADEVRAEEAPPAGETLAAGAPLPRRRPAGAAPLPGRGSDGSSPDPDTSLLDPDRSWLDPDPSSSPDPDSPVRPAEPVAPLPRRGESARTGRPDPTGLAEPAPPDHDAGVGGLTANGLPRRVRQASLAAPLRSGPPPAPAGDVLAGRTPEQVRRVMSSYQRGTARGRADAAGSKDGGPDPTSGAPPGEPVAAGSEPVSPPVTKSQANGQNQDSVGPPTEDDSPDR